MAQEDKRLRRRVRNSYFISTVSIAMVLFLLGSVTYLILNVLNVTNRLKESVTVYIMLDNGLSAEQTAQLRQSIEAEDVVRELVYVSKKEAAAKFIAESGEDFTDFLGAIDGDDEAAGEANNPLPNSFEARLNARASEKQLVGGFAAKVEAMPGVEEAVYQKGIVEQIGTNLGKFNLVLLLFGAALLVISLILLRNTIRMTIIAKRQIINTMKLVGANEGFIMRPFLGSAALHGVYAGLIATAMFALLVIGLHEGVPEIELLTGNALLPAIGGAMIVGGVVISLLFTVFAVDRAVKQTANKMYI